MKKLYLAILVIFFLNTSVFDVSLTKFFTPDKG